ncbi:MAG: excinuclease ABC subunit A [bacterium F083]|nr:MAG: excinuclease ABC subunit A [bacterium F083]
MFYPKIPKCFVHISPKIRKSYYFLLPHLLFPRFSVPLQIQFFRTLKEQTTSYITIRNAKVNNLKSISLQIPKNKLVVITGLSGSGKSSLAFDTLYAEGQRRYVESLSSYARQFMGRLNKPDVESITGLSPAIAIEQKVNSHNPRSTVGTSTEIYEYLKLLYARIGKTYSPASGKLVKKHQVMDVVNHILGLPTGSTAYIVAPLHLPEGRSLEEHLNILMQQGFYRILYNGEIVKIEDFLDQKKKVSEKKVKLLIDRIKVNESMDDAIGRISDSVQTAFYEGKETCQVISDLDGERKEADFSSRFEADGITFEPPTANMFAFNNPYGACPTCQGFGSVIGIDPDLVVPNKSLSIYENAIACWRGEKMSEWKDALIRVADKVGIPIFKPFYELTDEQVSLLWTGNQYFEGIVDFFNYVESQSYKIQYRVMLSRYRGKTVCPECHGTRLRRQAQYVKVGGKSITDLVLMPLDELKAFFDHLKLDETDSKIASRLLVEINNRLDFIIEVGLGYLTLNRLSNTLSGGESQRINLATSLGSSLVGSTYILDEPSIGLHSRDTEQLIKVLKRLRDIGNTVIVVEHDEEIIRAADYIIDIGPMAGAFGGEVVFEGEIKDLVHCEKSLTTQYLTGKMSIPVPTRRRKSANAIVIKGATQNNLKNLTVRFPLNMMTVITGVSGSGKSTLVKDVLYPAMKRQLGENAEKCGSYGALEGDLRLIQAVEFIDQNPIGKSSRSNPATYLKAYDEIRQLFSEQKLAKLRGIKPAFFSFNVPGGRCEECEGEGVQKIEMQFMADVYLPCEACHGTRFKEEVLEIKYDGKHISDILNMSIEEAIDFFEHSSEQQTAIVGRIVNRLKPLQEVGLGYLKLGQSSSSLSGGEAQRVKLAYFLIKGQVEKPTLFIFDEPTTGLHFHDVNKLLESFNALIANGHSVIIIEHNMDVIKSADWVIDLGPESGNKGGEIIFEGTPEDLVKCKASYTGKALKSKL